MSVCSLSKVGFRILGVLVVLYGGFVGFVFFRQRSLLYFPSHVSRASALGPWLEAGRMLGCCREVSNPRTIWLMMHGNAGQAADRDYVLPHLSAKDSLYVMEYPGYGSRQGSPSAKSLNEAAVEAYLLLRGQHPDTPICVLGESVGSGPACHLADEKPPPDKIVLVVPFDSLVSVAAEHFPFLPVRLMLRDRWDNVAALKNYKGPVDIFGAVNDRVIAILHAKSLARQIHQAHFTAIPGGHNDWSECEQVRLEP